MHQESKLSDVDENDSTCIESLSSPYYEESKGSDCGEGCVRSRSVHEEMASSDFRSCASLGQRCASLEEKVKSLEKVIEERSRVVEDSENERSCCTNSKGPQGEERDALFQFLGGLQGAIKHLDKISSLFFDQNKIGDFSKHLRELKSFDFLIEDNVFIEVYRNSYNSCPNAFFQQSSQALSNLFHEFQSNIVALASNVEHWRVLLLAREARLRNSEAAFAAERASFLKKRELKEKSVFENIAREIFHEQYNVEKDCFKQNSDVNNKSPALTYLQNWTRDCTATMQRALKRETYCPFPLHESPENIPPEAEALLRNLFKTIEMSKNVGKQNGMVNAKQLLNTLQSDVKLSYFMSIFLGSEDKWIKKIDHLKLYFEKCDKMKGVVTWGEFIGAFIPNVAIELEYYRESLGTGFRSIEEMVNKIAISTAEVTYSHSKCSEASEKMWTDLANLQLIIPPRSSHKVANRPFQYKLHHKELQNIAHRLVRERSWLMSIIHKICVVGPRSDTSDIVREVYSGEISNLKQDHLKEIEAANDRINKYKEQCNEGKELLSTISKAEKESKNKCIKLTNQLQSLETSLAQANQLLADRATIIQSLNNKLSNVEKNLDQLKNETQCFRLEASKDVEQKDSEIALLIDTIRKEKKRIVELEALVETSSAKCASLMERLVELEESKPRNVRSISCQVQLIQEESFLGPNPPITRTNPDVSENFDKHNFMLRLDTIEAIAKDLLTS